MQPTRFLAASLLASAVLGLAACTQGGAGNLSGTAGEGPAEGAPAVEATVESLPVTESAPPAASPAAGDATGEGPVIPDAFIAAPDPKSDASSGTTDSAGTGNTDGLGAAEVNAYVAAHNRWRANYGTPPMSWDATVAAYAQEWADNLAARDAFEHRTERRYGENIWMGTAGHWGPDGVVDDWGSEVKDWDLTCTGGINVCCAPGAVCGHFTQVVWSTSTRLGCGKATSASGNDVVVCNYAPAGNMIGEEPFPPRTGDQPTAVPQPTSAPQPTTAAQPTSAPRATAVPQPTTASGSTAPKTYWKDYTNLNLAIPDAGAPVAKTLKVSQTGKIQGLSVFVKITHTYVGDLSVKLVHPDGTEVVLHDQTGGSEQNIETAYGTDGIPVAELAQLNGKPMAGNWQLVVQDHAEADAGTLDAVRLTIKYTAQ